MVHRREQILAVATRLFAENGFSNTTVREIGAECGLLSGSLYHHFQSKEQMLNEILTSFIGEMLEKYHAVIEADLPPEDQLVRFVETAFENVVAQREIAIVAQNESRRLLASGGNEHIKDGYAAVERLWISVIERGIETGVFRADLDPKLAYLFARDAIWVTARWWKPDGEYSLEYMSRMYTALIFGAISNAPAHVATDN